VDDMHKALELSNNLLDLKEWLAATLTSLPQCFPSSFREDVSHVFEDFKSLFKVPVMYPFREVTMNNVRPFRISLADICTALDGNWMNDFVLTAALHLIREPMQEKFLIADSLFLSNAIFTFNEAKPKKGVMKGFNDSIEALLIPRNRHGIHWTLICVFLRRSELCILTGLIKILILLRRRS
jgi:hypothetical protein